METKNQLDTYKFRVNKLERLFGETARSLLKASLSERMIELSSRPFQSLMYHAVAAPLMANQNLLQDSLLESVRAKLHGDIYG